MRQEAFENKLLCRQARVDQSRHKSSRSRQTLHFDAAFHTLTHQKKPRIGDGRCTCIGHQGQSLSRLDTVSDTFHHLMLVADMESGHRLADVEMTQQIARSAGILGKNSIHLLQNTDGAKCDVFKVANRRRNEIQLAHGLFIRICV